MGLLGGALQSLLNDERDIADLIQIVFAGPPLLSKKTGADKRTSAFIFGNSSAASVLKKEWRKRN
jgi:hypothetical protein